MEHVEKGMRVGVEPSKRTRIERLPQAFSGLCVVEDMTLGFAKVRCELTGVADWFETEALLDAGV